MGSISARQFLDSFNKERQIIEPEVELERIRATVRERIKTVQDITPLDALGVIPVITDTTSLAGSVS